MNVLPSCWRAVPNAEGYSLLYQTSINSVRQKTQEIIKQDLESLGFSVELKSIDAAVFFSSDAGNPDTYPHFYADLEMYTNGPSSPYPITWADRYRSRRHLLAGERLVGDEHHSIQQSGVRQASRSGAGRA